MLIECNNCGAPLDVKDKAPIVRCCYCGVQSRLERARTVAAQTPEDWHPPPEWRPPAHAKANSERVLNYHRPLRAIRAIVSIAFTLVVGVGAVVFFLAWQPLTEQVAGRVLSDPATQEATRSAFAQAAKAIEQATRAAGNAAQTAAGGVNYFAEGGPDQALTSFKEHLGSKKLEAKQLLLYPNYAFIEAKNPKNPKHFDRYTLRNGRVGDANPIANTRLKDVGPKLFDPDKVVVQAIPKLIARTVSELGYEQGEASHVIIESNLPFSKDVVIRIYVKGPRDSGRIDYRSNGTELRVFR